MSDAGEPRPLTAEELRTGSLRAHVAAVAGVATGFISTVELVATGEHDESALAVLLMALGSAVSTSADLAVLERPRGDVPPEAAAQAVAEWPDERTTRLAADLARVLDGGDAYDEVAHPLGGPGTRRAAVSDDLARIAQELARGLAHVRAGREEVALVVWWRSCLRHWADRAASAQRTMMAVVRSVQTLSGPEGA